MRSARSICGDPASCGAESVQPDLQQGNTMTSGTNQRTGGQVLVDQLKIHGVDLAFCVPGESYLGVLDALWDARDAIRLITTRNEIGACNMAESYGKVTGRPGICLVTRGPGASHAMVGIHTAFQDSTPLILFVGQVAREAREREAFQEIDVKQMFGHTAKWAAEISDPRRIPEMLSHAFHLAMSGRPGPGQPLVHIHADPDELGRVYQGELLIAAGMAEFAAAAKALKPVEHAAWSDWAEGARRDYLKSLEPDPSPGTLDYGRVMKMIGDAVPPETIMASDAGNFAGWLNRFYQFPGYRTLVGPTNGAMGYGVPAAVAAKLAHPDRPVLCFARDCGLMMTGQELATAVQYGANVVFLVIHDTLYGTIRMYQEREYPNRYPATELRNPDFAAYARAFGAHGETVRETAEFPAAFARALKADTPSVIELRLDPEAITSRTTLTALRNAAIARQAAAR